MKPLPSYRSFVSIANRPGVTRHGDCDLTSWGVKIGCTALASRPSAPVRGSPHEYMSPQLAIAMLVKAPASTDTIFIEISQLVQ